MIYSQMRLLYSLESIVGRGVNTYLLATDKYRLL